MVAGLDDVRQVLLHFSFFPRLAVSLMAGAALALAGTLFQQILRNPLAEPVTLGVSAGANLALSAATIFAPTLLVHGLEAVTWTGAALATALLFAFAWGRTLSPLRFILAGMVISLYCVSLNALLVLFNHDYLIDLLLWQAGSLNQSGWDGVLYLAPRLAVAMVIALLMVRPLAALGLEDEGAAAVGVNLRRTRVLGLAVAVALSAFVTSAVGMLAFVGLAAPAIARLCGARTLKQRLIWAPLLGAALLCVVDQIARELSRFAGNSRRHPHRHFQRSAAAVAAQPPAQRRDHPAPGASQAAASIRRLIIGMAILLALLTLPAIYFAVDANGWHWGDPGLSDAIAQWRLPRVLGSLAAGAMLAVAGLLVQRLTGNPMASPEVLGATSGAAIAVLVLFVRRSRTTWCQPPASARC